MDADSIFNFTDYKDFLKSHVQKTPRSRGFYARLSSQLNVQPALVSQVISGNKDFTLEQAHEVTEFIALSEMESEYFILLVEKERAGTFKLKKYFSQKIERAKKQSLEITNRIKKEKVLSEADKTVFYSSWIYSAVRLFCSIDKGQDLNSISHEFSIPRQKAQEIMNYLVDTDLCRVQSGRYVMGSQSTHVESTSPHVHKHHANWRLLSLHKSNQLTAEEMMFTSPLSLSADDFQKVREIFVSAIQKTSALVKDSPAEIVACLNIDLIRLTKR